MTILILNSSITPTHNYIETMSLFYRTKILVAEEMQQLFTMLTSEDVDLVIMDIHAQNAMNILGYIPLIKQARSKVPILLHNKGLTNEGKTRIEIEYGISLILDYNKDLTKLIQVSRDILFNKNHNKEHSNDNSRNDASSI